MIVLLAGVLVFSQGQRRHGGERGGPPRDGFRGGPGGPGGPNMLGFLERDLNLTDEQKTQIKSINESFEASTKDLRDQLRAQHEKQANPFSTAFDEAAVRSAAEARAKIEVELQVARARMMSQIGALLTAEQKAQIAARHSRGPQGPPTASPEQ